MKKIHIGKFEFYALFVLYTSANDKIRGIYFKILKQDIFITLLISFVGSLFLVMLYYLIFKRMKYKNFEQILKKLLGNKLGKLLLLIYSTYFITLALMDLKDITHLNKSYILGTTPVFTIGFIIIMTVYISIVVGLEATSRISTIMYWVLMFIFISFSILVILSNKLNFGNILPILEIDKKTILENAYYNTYSVPYGETFVFIIFFKYLAERKDAFKLTFLGQITFGILVITVTFLSIIILGPLAMEYGHSPGVQLTKRIDIAEFIQRFDLLVVMLHVLTSYIKQFILIYAATYCAKHVFNKVKYRVIATIFTLLVFIGSLSFLKEYITYLSFRKDVFIPYISPIFELYIPIGLLALTFLITDKEKKSEIKIKEEDYSIAIE